MNINSILSKIQEIALTLIVVAILLVYIGRITLVISPSHIYLGKTAEIAPAVDY